MSNPLDIQKPVLEIEYDGKRTRLHELEENYHHKDLEELLPIVFGAEHKGELIISNPTAYEYLIVRLEFADPAITLGEYDKHIMPQKATSIPLSILTETARKRPVDTRYKLIGGYIV